MEEIKERFEKKYIMEPNTGCWLWFKCSYPSGYGSLRIGSRKDGTRKMIGAHIISYQLHKGAVPSEMCVLHKCDIPSCVNPNHLFLGTKKDNTIDMLNKKRGSKPWLGFFGEKHPKHKLSDIQIIEIRNKFQNGNISQRELVKQYGTTQGQISKIINKIRRSS